MGDTRIARRAIGATWCHQCVLGRCDKICSVVSTVLDLADNAGRDKLWCYMFVRPAPVNRQIEKSTEQHTEQLAGVTSLAGFDNGCHRIYKRGF